jgi:BirA family biotin operon repressor/biotin-[acetyl-CoA-carboxylase] ligase
MPLFRKKRFAPKITKLRCMSAFPAGYSFYKLPQVSSTNMYAMERLYAGLAGNRDVFFAVHQLQGKGQRGKEWHSAPGESILMSLVLDSSKLAPSQSFRLSAAVALAACNFLQHLVGEEISIKWPNDIYWGDRKAGGILIENLLNAGTFRWSVVGIGININQAGFPVDLPNAVSVKMITGQTYAAEALAKELCGHIEDRWQQVLQGKWPEMLEEYNQALYGRGQIKKLRKGNAVIPCVIKGVNSHGVLVGGENDEWQFQHGEVEWVSGRET